MVHVRGVGRLLRTHVVRRSHHRAGDGDARHVQALGQSHVGDLGDAVLADEYVGGFYVAVNDVFAVRVRQRRSDLTRHLQRFLHRQTSALEYQLRQRLAVDVLHGDVVVAVVAAGSEDRDYVRMQQPRRRFRLLREATHEVLLHRQLRRQNLQRDHSIDALLHRFVDPAHAARAQQTPHAIVAEDLADQRIVDRARLHHHRRRSGYAHATAAARTDVGVAGRVHLHFACHAAVRTREQAFVHETSPQRLLPLDSNAARARPHQYFAPRRGDGRPPRGRKTPENSLSFCFRTPASVIFLCRFSTGSRPFRGRTE